MKERHTRTGLNKLVTTTLSDTEREDLENLRIALGWSVSGFVRRAIRQMILEQKTNEIVSLRMRLQANNLRRITE